MDTDEPGCHCLPDAAPPSHLVDGRWICDWCDRDTDPYRDDEPA